jgi:CRISPR-associated protein Csx3
LSESGYPGFKDLQDVIYQLPITHYPLPNMTTYHINIQKDTLKVKFGEPAEGDQIARDAARRLEELINNGELKGGELLKIDGPATLAVSYIIASFLAHRFQAIAVFDPKLCKEGHKTFVVVISHTPKYQVGDLIHTPEIYKSPDPLKIVLCGPPHSGKSCLREGLKQAIVNIDNVPYPYVITACPDGEGSYFSEAAKRDPELARRLKQEYKAKFTMEFAEKAAGWVELIPG